MTGESIVGDFLEDRDVLRSPRTVVVLPALEVSADGGGGSPASSNRSSEAGPALLFIAAVMLCMVGRMLARHRKHSPVP